MLRKNDLAMHVLSLRELVSLLKSMRSGWGPPLEMGSRMHNSKYWVMEADVWADLLMICRWANPTTIYCQTCSKHTEAVTTSCNHVVCMPCIATQDDNGTRTCLNCGQVVTALFFVSAMATPQLSKGSVSAMATPQPSISSESG